MMIKKVTIENIRSYENATIEFPKGSILLAGDIGSGKTSILLAIQFALFGLQPGQKGSSILRQGTDSACVILEMEIDGKEVIIERRIKKSKNGSIGQESNIIRVDDSIEDLSTSEMKERVISLINYPKDFIKKSNLLYKYTVYTPQEEMKAIIQEKPEVRLDTLRHIFGIDRYKRIKENSSIFLQKIKEAIKIKEVLSSELNLLKEKFNLENEKKISITRELNNLEIENKRIIEEKSILEDKINSYNKIIEEKRKIESEISKLKIMLTSKIENESKIKKDIAMLQRQFLDKVNFSQESLNNVIELYEKHKKILEEKQNEMIKLSSQISVLESKKDQAYKMIEKVSSLENCPTCFQKVSKEHKEKIKKMNNFEIGDLNRELSQKLFDREKLKKEIEKEKELIIAYDSDKNRLIQEKIKFNHQKEIEIKIKSDSFILERISNEIKEIKEKINLLEKQNENIINPEEEYKKISKDYENLYEIARKKEIAIAMKRRELEIIKENIKDISKEIEKKEKVREELNYLREFQDWFSEKFLAMVNLSEKNVMIKLKNEFSKIFSDWFSILANESLSVKLNEEFTPIILNQDYEIEYEFLSGGERTAVALAYRLALNQVLNSILSNIKTKDILILDEPTEGFSSDQIDKMRDIFEQVKAKQLILVSHEQKIEGFVDHIIRIKKDGTSKIYSIE